MAEETRVEKDSMGDVRIPGWAYWGAQTQRAVENFSVSEHRIPAPMIRALALIKKNAAIANGELGTVRTELTAAIRSAADEVLAGNWDRHFPIDVFQTGSGTSWNMNANELIANRASEILGEPIGRRHPVHPNDHVNRGQSSNDVIPTAIHVANRMELPSLVSAVESLSESFRRKADEFARVVKIGRTHLQDAVPMTVGQEFDGFAVQMKKAAERLERTMANLEELALGGTAVGTGLNAHPEFAEKAISGIASETGIPFRAAESRFEAIGTRDAQVELAGALNSLAVSLMKIANDLRLLASGPRAALGEIILPELQPGSSIMPGKVNPVIPEMIIQVAAHVIGKAASITTAGQNSPLELNMMNPLIAYETLSAISLLRESCAAFAERCVDGIAVDEKRCEFWIEWSLALVTPLATEIGYDKAAARQPRWVDRASVGRASVDFPSAFAYLSSTIGIPSVRPHTRPLRIRSEDI
ncbi:MAG: class II fumarate hydratase [Spirochaetota bacterium]